MAATQQFDFDKGSYGLRRPLWPQDAARFQIIVVDFMDLVRQKDGLKDPDDRPLVDRFCKFIDDMDMWHLVEPMVPEFSSGSTGQKHDPSSDAGFNWIDYIRANLTCILTHTPNRQLRMNVDREDEIMGYRYLRHLEFLQRFGPAFDDPATKSEANDQRIAQILQGSRDERQQIRERKAESAAIQGGQGEIEDSLDEKQGLGRRNSDPE